MAADAVRLRLLYVPGPPILHEGQPWVFGLQDTRGGLHDGAPLEGGLHAYDFQLRVKPGPDSNRPVFSGDFASGTPTERFVYLSWKDTQTGAWINRLKAKLSPIAWPLVREAQAYGAPITASMAGRQLGDTRPPTWRVG
jgi:Family of unknown function (DUF5990)